MKLKRAEAKSIRATLLLGTAVSILILAGCSEFDPSRGVDPNLSILGDSAQVFLFSDPAADALILAVEEEQMTEVREVETPETVTLPSGDYVIRFSRLGYSDVLAGVLLGAGSMKEVSVTLDSIPERPIVEPPTVSITVDPDEIDEGEPVSVTVSSDGDVGILLPIGVFTTEGTYGDVPSRPGTVVYSFAAFRDGLWATAADTVFVRPQGPQDPEDGQVLVFSDPESDAEIFDITPQGELVSTGETRRTPFIFEREAGPVAFTFREPGYIETTRAVLLGAGQVKEINVVLLPSGSPVDPPTVELSVMPPVVREGEPVTYSIRTTGADYSILLGQHIITSTESEWTWTETPDRTRISSAIAFGDGGVAQDTTMVAVETEPGELDCATIEVFPAYGPNRDFPRVIMTEDPITVPEHTGEVTIRVRATYSGDIPGQEDEAFAIGLARGNQIVWAHLPGETCPVIPDPGFTVETRVWVDCGGVDVPPGDYDLVAWHVVTGEFPCYQPLGDLSGPNSVNMDAAEVTYCQER